MNRPACPTISLILALLLAACGAKDEDPGVGGVTVGEAKALNEAAAMLDKGRPANVASPMGAPLPPPRVAKPGE